MESESNVTVSESVVNEITTIATVGESSSNSSAVQESATVTTVTTADDDNANKKVTYKPGTCIFKKGKRGDSGIFC